MIRRKRLVPHLCVVGFIIWLLGNSVFAQKSSSKYRRLAPGVVTRIQPDIETSETFSGPREIVELIRGQADLEWSPHFTSKTNTLYAKAGSTIFQKPVWGLEFGFKPVRLIEVDGKKVWYMVFQVKNNGRHKRPKPVTDANGNVTYSTEFVNHSVRFFPAFILESHEIGRAYLDKLSPKAFQKIAQREDPNRKFYNTVNISSVSIRVSTEEEDNSLWGIATWENVDPRTDFFSIYVSGLTNAYQWQDPPGAFKQGDPPGQGRRFSFKTLKLNFWRPGDDVDVKESEIRFGLPTNAQLPPDKTEDELLKIYRLEERVDNSWVYR